MNEKISAEELRSSLDRRLAALQGDPLLARRIMACAKKKSRLRKTPVGVIIAFCILMLGMAAALAAANGWRVMDFLFPGRETPLEGIAPKAIQREAASDGAWMRISSAVYDGRTLAFDWFIENTKPQTPMYCRVTRFTANGQRVWTDGTDSFDECWIPGLFCDSALEDGELILLPEEAALADTLHVEMQVSLYRPERPVALIGGGEEFDAEEAERKAGDGYYVIPGGDGFVARDAEMGWTQVFMPRELPEDMGGYRLETLEISFDLPLPQGKIQQLQTKSVYETAHGEARYETAVLTPLGLYLTMKTEPRDDFFRQPGEWALTDEAGKALVDPMAAMQRIRLEGYAAGGTYAAFQWYGLTAKDLPDTVSLTWLPAEGDAMVFPVKIP